MTIGRKNGDILLDLDSRVSSLHAHVIARQDGGLTVEDAGSQNQLIYNGAKVPRIDLFPKTTFQIGQSVFEVELMSPEEAQRVAPNLSWKQLILDLLEKNVDLDSSSAKALKPAVKIEAISGPNSEDNWHLGFGPRLFGPLCEDNEILESDSGDIAFEIRQGAEGPMIKSHTTNLTLNKNRLSQNHETYLSDGDEIHLGVSVFKVRLT